MVRPATYLSLIIAMLSCSASASAAGENRTGIMHPQFATLQVYAGDDPLNDAVVTLDDSREITITFDELADDVRYMRYDITHCNADWQPSGLVESEFLEGFNEGYVTDWQFSRATTVHYVHYRITIPNEQIKLTVSGNYLLRVYDESDPEATLLQARFMVTEQSVNLDASVSTRTDVDYNDAHQQLSLAVDASQVPVHDAFNDFKVVITQNGRLDNASTILHPLRVSGGKLIYEHQPGLIFPAGNEYRRFENISTTVPSMRIEEVAYHAPYYHAYVTVDEPRCNQPYNYDRTQSGRYLIREYNSTQSDIEADYVVTHFALLADPVEGADIYLDGDLVNRRFDGKSRLVYNAETGMHETVLLLKQGAYNYQYLVKKHGDHAAITAPIEGDFYNTVNEYNIAVYRRYPGERYDRLAGYFTIRSL